MWHKHRSASQDNVNYIHNDTVKPFRLSIIKYSRRVHKIHELKKYLPTPLKKGNIYDQGN